MVKINEFDRDLEERQPTQSTYKNRILIKLDEISKLYEYTNVQMQLSQYKGTITQEMFTGLIKYTSKITTLYKMLKPKLEVGISKKKGLEELKTIDKYQMIMDEIKEDFDVDKAFILFNLFAFWEDLLRELCEALGYISDKPK